MKKKAIAAVTDAREEKNGFDKFAELMQEVAGLPAEQQEKVCIYIQGFMACSTSRQQQAV